LDRLRRALGALTTERGQTIFNRVCVAGLIVVGALDAWFTRQWNVNPDGVSYIDVARAFVEHGPGGLINGYWSPLYPAVVGVAMKVVAPARDVLYPMVRAINFVVFVVALLAFARLLRIAVARHEVLRAAPASVVAIFLVAAWALFYSLVSQAIGQALVTPDMGVAAVVFFVAAELLTLGEAHWTVARWIRLGIVLAIGYWWKAILFPVGGVALVIAVVIAWRRRDSLRGPAAAAIAFGALALALAVPVSRQVGRATFGETGRLNHLWFVNNVSMVAVLCVPPGAPLSGSGVSAEPVLLERPLTCSTADAPNEVTLPLWFDPSPQYAKARNQLSAAQTLVAARNNVEYMRAAFVEWLPWAGIALGIAFVAVVLARAFSAASLPLVAFGAVPIAAYFSVYVELRHIVPFIMLIALATLAALARRTARWSRAVLAIVALTAVGEATYRIATQQRVEAAIALHELRGDPRPEQISISVARGLADRGLAAGDRVAAINTMWNVDWAQRVGLVVRAYVPEYTYGIDAAYAALSEPCTRGRFLDTMRSQRIKAIVLRDVPLAAPSWFEQIGDTPFRVAMVGAAEPLPAACSAPATRSSSGTAAR
jgi:hypothetical protein